MRRTHSRRTKKTRSNRNRRSRRHHRKRGGAPIGSIDPHLAVSTQPGKPTMSWNHAVELSETQYIRESPGSYEY